MRLLDLLGLYVLMDVCVIYGTGAQHAFVRLGLGRLPLDVRPFLVNFVCVNGDVIFICSQINVLVRLVRLANLMIIGH